MSSRARRRAVVVVAGALLVLVGIVALGRWERSRNAADQNQELARIRALVGSLDQPALDGFRRQPAFDCLAYRRGANPFALELCFDARGRLVEAIDRRTEKRRIPSLRSDPSAATTAVPRSLVDSLLRRMKRVYEEQSR